MEIAFASSSSLSIFTDNSTYQYIIQLLLQYRYIALIPITLLEGPAVMMVAGFSLHFQVLSFWPTYFALMAGDLLGDILWYGIGYRFGNPFVRRFGKFVSINDEQIEIVKKLFHRHGTKILVISKVTMGLGFALVTLLVAGLSKISFKKYLGLNAFGQLFWTGFLMSIGYFLGGFYVSVNNVLGKLSAIGFLVIVFFCLIGFGKYLRSRITKTYSS